MVSRLDRLFILLDTGSNESVRLAAAKQLGEVQRVQPNDLDYLLQRIKEYSGKTIWETRVAAGQATRCVLEQVNPWPPVESQTFSSDDKDRLQQYLLAEKLIEKSVDTEQILENFDLDHIISSCPKLLSLDTTDTDGQELVNPSNSRGSNKGRGRAESGSRARKNDKEQLLRQRKLINKELGISMVDSFNLGVKSTDIITNDDLKDDYEANDATSSASRSAPLQQDTRMTIQLTVSNYDRIIDLLAREKCIVDRNTKICEISIGQSSREVSSESNSSSKPFDEWPLASITRQYINDLFNPSWEIRHGAAIALREIVKSQGSSAGKRLHFTDASNIKLNQLWLVDIALKALSVLALDKFGDFLFDQVVAPVRENAAQLLGCCVANMSNDNACSTIKLALKMLKDSNWETRHGGILGLKYSLNVVDKSLSMRILKECFDPIFKCLGDPVDDVSAEAAASLVPVKDLMIETIPDKAPKLIKFLWEHLADLDELTTSTSNIVLLLASLITSSSTQLDPCELKKSIPRLWSLLGHSSTSVRISVLKALITLIEAHKSNCLSWMPEDLLQTALRLVFQRAMLENMNDVRPFIEEVWMHLIKVDNLDAAISKKERFALLKSTSQFLNSWLCLVMHPSNSPIDRSSPMWLNIRPDGSPSNVKPDGVIYIASITFNADTMNQQKLQVTKCRLLGTNLLGALYANLVNDFSESEESQHSRDTLKYLADMFIHYTKTKSANPRVISGWTIESWASHQSDLLGNDKEKLVSVLPKSLVDQLNIAITEISLCYDELASTFTRLQQETRDYVSALKTADISVSLNATTDKRVIYNLNQIQSLCDLDILVELTKVTSKKSQNASKGAVDHDVTRNPAFPLLCNKKANLIKSLKFTNLSQKALSTSVRSSLACAHISWRLLPLKLKLITDPLLDSIEMEEEVSLQDKSIKYLIILFDMLCQDLPQHNSLVESMIDRLIEILSSKALSVIFDSDETFHNVPISPRSSLSSDTRNKFDIHKIILLDNLQRKAELCRVMSRRQSSINSTSSLKRTHSLTSSIDLENDSVISPEDSKSAPRHLMPECSDTKMRGAEIALSRIVSHFEERLPNKLPKFWATITSHIKSAVEANSDGSNVDGDNCYNDSAISLIKSLRVLEVVGESLSNRLSKHLLELFNDLMRLLSSNNPLIRHHSAQCIGVICKLMFAETIDLVTQNIVPMLERSDNAVARCGSIEAIALIIEHLQLDLVPKINMFMIHVLRRMSDQNDQVRLMATHCFGKLLSLMPLNLNKCNISSSDKGNLHLENVKQDDRNFIEQLLDIKKLDTFIMPFHMKTNLRSYQQDGLNWLAFLNRFNLHGILCDEMGLGKTLMTISMVASDHVKSDGEVKYTDSLKSHPSLIVCPSTLTEHWLYEIEKFLPDETKASLNPAAYSGALNERMNLRCQILRASNGSDNSKKLVDQSNRKNVNLIVASYDIVRNDIEFFKEVHWNYCVLDEGHIIKNGKTKLSRAIRLINAKHRLILSGTPIQNNVTELWSLFDFLMPGFLGSERQFNSRYAKPILQSRELKCSPRDLEAGALAMESLHRQVLPFILRRLKEDVLDDLPPKIIQDYFCELSPLQQKLYEDFTRSKLCKTVTKKSIHNLEEQNEEDSLDTKADSKSHVFQALQYLKNVCNHPKLVLNEKHSQYQEIKKTLDSEKSSLDDILHSSKLKALKQLLLDCGIGIANQVDEQQQSITIESVVNQHRALVFCQIRSMANIIENDLLKKHLPSVTYLKLDGSIPPNQRHSIVSRFNNDPSIDILLLTTQIGGLGLNLTGADTVIFVEHDWNPTKDLQAMDRAHRIGQKKVVNVYRLITKGTLEEKIMGLQKFKTMVSNTVINQDNAGLGTMNVDQLLDLFEDNGTSEMSSADTNRQGDSGKAKSSFMDLLPELWDQQQYETEYDLSNFVSSLKN